MSDSQWREDVDRQTSEWIDADDPGSVKMRHDRQLDDRSQARIADLQLMEVLLASMSAGARNDQSERIDRVMSAIPTVTIPGHMQRSKESSPMSRRKWRPWSTLVALAACLLAIFAASSVLLTSESRAGTLLPKINEVAIQNIDRVYNVSRKLPSAASKQTEISGKLYLRGVEGFVLACGDAVFGRDASEFWFVSSSGEVIIADSFAWMIEDSEKRRQELGLLKELSLASTRVPLMELSAVVQLMQHDYDVTVNSGVRHRQQIVDELVGKQKGGNSELPDTIRLWSGAESRIIHVAQFVWGNEKENSPPKTLVFELVDAEDVPENWYSHEAHH